MRNIVIKKFDFLTYSAYVLFLFYWMFSSVKGLDNIRIFSIKMCYVVLVISCILKMLKMRKKELLIALICISISAISYAIVDSNYILLIMLFCISLKNIDFNHFVKLDFVLKIIFLLIIVSLFYLGFTENYYLYRSDEIIRKSMGFSHPNVFGTYIFSICSEFIYLYYNHKQKALKYIVMLVLGIVVWYFCNSRTAIFGITLLAFIAFLYDKGIISKLMKNKKIISMVKTSFVLFTLITFLFVLLYNQRNTVALKINNLVSNRLYMASYYTQKYDVNLFGTDIELLGTKQATEENKKSKARILDNSYAMIILNYGMAVYAMLVYLYYQSNKRAIQEKNYILVFIMLLFCIYGLMENVLIFLQYNVFLLYLFQGSFIDQRKN